MPLSYYGNNLKLPAFAESRQLQLADECGNGTSAGFAEAGASVPPTSVGGAPPDLNIMINQNLTIFGSPPKDEKVAVAFLRYNT